VRLVIGLIVLTAAILAIGLFVAGHALVALAPVVLGGAWIAGTLYQRRDVGTLALPGLAAIAVIAVFASVSPLIALAGLVAALAAWSLHDMEQRITLAGAVEGEAAIRRVHRMRLLIVAALSLGIGGLATTLRFDTGTIGALLVALPAILGLSRVTAALRRAMQRRANDEPAAFQEKIRQ